MMPMLIKHLWQFYKPIFFINIVLSVALSFGSLATYPIVFMTFGYLCSAALVRFFEGNTKFLFYNLGYSRKFLLSYTFLANLIFSIILLILLSDGFFRQ